MNEQVEKLEDTLLWWYDSDGNGIGIKRISELAEYLHEKGVRLPAEPDKLQYEKCNTCEGYPLDCDGHDKKCKPSVPGIKFRGVSDKDTVEKIEKLKDDLKWLSEGQNKTDLSDNYLKEHGEDTREIYKNRVCDFDYGITFVESSIARKWLESALSLIPPKRDLTLTCLSKCPCPDCEHLRGFISANLVEQAEIKRTKPCTIQCPEWKTWQDQLAQLSHNQKEQEVGE